MIMHMKRYTHLTSGENWATNNKDSIPPCRMCRNEIFGIRKTRVIWKAYIKVVLVKWMFCSDASVNQLLCDEEASFYFLCSSCKTRISRCFKFKLIGIPKYECHVLILNMSSKVMWIQWRAYLKSFVILRSPCLFLIGLQGSIAMIRTLIEKTSLILPNNRN